MQGLARSLKKKLEKKAQGTGKERRKTIKRE